MARTHAGGRARRTCVHFLSRSGVRDTSAVTGASYPNMPLVGRGWPAGNAFFKAEGAQINIGLGRGGALEIFNNNVARVNVIRQ